MAIRSDEIGDILKQRIASFEAPVVDANEGVITSVNDGIARVYGLERAMAGELLEFPGPGNRGSVLGLALDLREDGVGAVIMGPFEHLQDFAGRTEVGLLGPAQDADEYLIAGGSIASVPLPDENLRPDVALDGMRADKAVAG